MTPRLRSCCPAALSRFALSRFALSRFALSRFGVGVLSLGVFALVGATGCWQGPSEEGVYRCASDSECPPDWFCVPEAGGGRCYSERRDGGMDGGRQCSGCLDMGSGICRAGDTEVACGQAGAACQACATGERCEGGACVLRESCGPGDCEGCCDGNECVTESRNDACGGGGAACMACDVGEVCRDGECAEPASCNPSNCAGCCAGDVCESGASDTACGVGGGVCSVCDGTLSCVEGVCELPCAERCFGCCDGETCLDGNADAACGFDGEACFACAANDACDGFGCVSRSCSDSCGGCCDGETCLSGTLLNACGAGGNMCMDCGSSFRCAAGGCEVDPVSRWHVTVVRASFPTLDANGVAWDVTGNPLPDSRAMVEAVDDGLPLSGTTATLDNTASPRWDERVLNGLRADDLMRGMQITVVDVDTLSFNDVILVCVAMPTSADFVRGTMVLACEPSPSDSTSVAGQLVLSLSRA